MDLRTLANCTKRGIQGSCQPGPLRGQAQKLVGIKTMADVRMNSWRLTLWTPGDCLICWRLSFVGPEINYWSGGGE